MPIIDQHDAFSTFIARPLGAERRSNSEIGQLVVAVSLLASLGPVIDLVAGNTIGAGPGRVLWLMTPLATLALVRPRPTDVWPHGAPHRRRTRRTSLAPNPSATCWRIAIWWYPLSIVVASIVRDGWGNVVLDLIIALRWLPTISPLAVLPVVVAAILEEVGWRGRLTPWLEACGTSRPVNHLIVGGMAACWQLPYAMGHAHPADGYPATIATVLASSLVAAVVRGELRLVSGSIWPGVAMLSIETALFGHTVALTGLTPW
ncbi:MAG: CPBP family glutamic-type intramembrane protease [Acidimicrobiales bacterium]